MSDPLGGVLQYSNALGPLRRYLLKASRPSSNPGLSGSHRPFPRRMIRRHCNSPRGRGDTVLLPPVNESPALGPRVSVAIDQVALCEEC